MNTNFIVGFRGFSASSKAALVRMIKDDIAGYPKRLRMTSATVEEVKPAGADQETPEPAKPDIKPVRDRTVKIPKARGKVSSAKSAVKKAAAKKKEKVNA